MTSYERFLQLPLFQGLNTKKLTIFLEKVKFNFKTYQPSETIIRQGTLCNQLTFILEGQVTKYTEVNNFALTIEETLSSNELIEPTSLFGLNTNYNSSYYAKSEVTILLLEKNDLLNFLLNDTIFKLNFVNILSGKVHQFYNGLWYIGENNTLFDEFKKFITQRCEYLDAEITFRISMPDLAFLLRDTRLNVSKMLNLLEKNKVVELKRQTITIPHPRKLLNLETLNTL